MKLFYNKVDLEQLVKLKKFSKEIVNEEDKTQDSTENVYIFGFHKKILQISVVILVLNQLSGINAILLYAKQLFMRISEHDEDRSNQYLLILGAIQILATLAGGWLANEYGRKKTLIHGGMLVTGVLFLVFATYSWDQKQSKLLVLLILTYIIGYAMSIGSTSMIYLAELLPDLSIIIMIYWGMTLLASLTSPIILDAFGVSNTFLIFGAINAACLFYMRTHMVESQSKSRKQLVNEYLWDNKDVGDLQEYKIMSLSM
jgi:MFS family permease